MANETLGASFSIDVTDLKAGLAQANRLIKESQSEFQAAAAGMDDWTQSEDGLNAKIKSLNDITDIQRKKVNALQEQYDGLIEKGLDPTSKEAVELRTKINNETTALNKNEKELKKQTEALEELEDGTEDAGEATEDMGDKFAGLKKAGGIAVKAVAAVGAACVSAVTAFLGLAESTKETQTEWAKLESAWKDFDDGAGGIEAATESFYGLQGVLGDTGRAAEAAALMAKYSGDEFGNIEKNVRVLTGVFAEYGDSIPTEGLAEGIAATSEMGTVQGVLADALEWQGVNLDEYNAKLGEMSTAEERAAYIQETLLGIYGESADAYREANANLIEANEASARLDSQLAEIGKVALPIMTELKNMVALLLMDLMPFVELIGEGLTGALNGTAGAANTLAEGLTGIINALLEKIVSMLPFIIDTIVAVVPQLLTALLNQLPTILTTLINMVTQVMDGLTTMLPSIVNAIMEVLPQLINALVASIPQLLEAAIKLLMAIVDALPTIITALIDALPSVINTIITALLDSIPLLLDAAIKLLSAIIDAIPVIIDAIIENLPSIIDSIINGVLDALPLLLDAAIKLFFALIDAIPVIVEELWSAMPQIIETILSSVRDALPKLFSTAKELFGKIISAAGDLINELPSKMGEIISSITGGLKDGIGKIKDIGSDIVKGLWDGIKDMAGWIGEKIKGFGENVLGGIKSFFGIASPSKVMADQVGKNLALGIGEGFEKNIADVNKDITDAMNFDDPNYPTGGAPRHSGGGLTVYQTNNYKQAYSSRYEQYKSKQTLEATARLMKVGAV